MSSGGFLTNHCRHCGGGIEFPEAGIGEEIECPHCKAPIKLTTPSEMRAANFSIGEPLSEAWLSSAELLFLSKFRSPTEISALGNAERWSSVLDAQPTDVIDRFLGKGLLE